MILTADVFTVPNFDIIHGLFVFRELLDEGHFGPPGIRKPSEGQRHLENNGNFQKGT
jgi:hypothetical protein